MEDNQVSSNSIGRGRRYRRSSPLPLLGDDERKKLEHTQLYTRLHNLKNIFISIIYFMHQVEGNSWRMHAGSLYVVICAYTSLTFVVAWKANNGAADVGIAVAQELEEAASVNGCLKQKHHYHGGNNASLSRGRHGGSARPAAFLEVVCMCCVYPSALRRPIDPLWDVGRAFSLIYSPNSAHAASVLYRRWRAS